MAAVTGPHHVLASLGSPNKQLAALTARGTPPRVQQPHLHASPTARRNLAAPCSALPFGFPAFGFGGQPAGGSGPGHNSPAPTGGEGGSAWWRSTSASSSRAPTEGMDGGTGGAAAASVHASPPGSPRAGSTGQPGGARRRLNLLPLAAQTSTAAPAGPATPLTVKQPEQLQGGGGGLLPHRRSGAGCSVGTAEDGVMLSLVGLVQGPACSGGRLELRQLPQLLADVSVSIPAPGRGAFSSLQPQQLLVEQPQPHPEGDLATRRQRLLDALHSALASGSLRPAEAAAVPGLVGFLTEELGLAAPGAGGPGAAAVAAGLLPMRGITAATGMALECLCTLLSEDPMPQPVETQRPHHPPLHPLVQFMPALGGTLAVLKAARLPAAPAWGEEASAAPSPLLAGLSVHGDSRLPAVPSAGAASSSSDVTAAAAGWSPDVSAAFFAASVLVRMARYPDLAMAAVEVNAGETLVRLMAARPPMLAQMAVFAAYKLLRPQPGPRGPVAGKGPADAGLSPLEAMELVRREKALLAMAHAGGLAALCGCLRDLADRPSRDMASSLMLDMALVPQVPAVIAHLSGVPPLVCVMSDRRLDSATRMYSLLVLARLANHSPECQMDAVREGSLAPLLALVKRGTDDEQTHACRLLAILAQAVPTHGQYKDLKVVQAVLPLLRGQGTGHAPGSSGAGNAALVAEHAASVVAVLAQNPDMHFHIVGAGAVPAMVQLLSTGSDKARAYVLAALMLLCEGEERHAAVVVRAGALPALVAMVRGGGEAPAAATPGCAPSQRHIAHAQEFAAAVLCCMSRYVDVQEELVSHGAVPALVSCLGRGGADAAVHAAEALVHVAGGDRVHKRMVAGDSAASSVLLRLLSANKPSWRYWALQLLRVISTDDTALGLLVGLTHEQAQEHDPEPSQERDWDRSWGLRQRGLKLPWAGGEDAIPLGPAAPGSAICGVAQDSANAEARRLLAGPLSVLLGPFASGSLVDPANAKVAGGSCESKAADVQPTAGAPGAPSSSSHNGAQPPPPRGTQLIAALVQLLSWSDGGTSWQQGRCRVLSAWLLARMCGYSPLALLVLAAGAVRDLLTLLAEEQQRVTTMAAVALKGGSNEAPEPRSGDLTIPLLPGEGEGMVPPGSGCGGGEHDAIVSAGGLGALGASSGGAGLVARRTRFDGNAAAASEAALLAVSRLGREGRMEVMSELALRQWMGKPVRLDGLGGWEDTPTGK